MRGTAVGAHNLNTLRERLAPYMLRRTRDEVLDQLPPRTDTTLPVELTEPQREAHNDLNQPIARLASIRQRRPLTRAEFLRLMSLLTTQRIIANGLAQLQFKELWPSCCINLELPWNPAVLEQRIARIHRLGQTRPIDVYNLVAPGCIEERIAATVSAKAALFKSVFDGTGDEVLFEGSGSFLEQTCRPAAADTAEAPTDLDRDDQDRELDELIDAADESGDVPESPSPEGVGEERPDQVASGQEQRQAPRALPPAEDVRGLFSQIEVSRTTGGGLRLEAPPEAAATLAALFEGLAGLLSSAASRDPNR